MRNVCSVLDITLRGTMNGYANSLAHTCTAIAAAFLWNCSSLRFTGLSYYCTILCT